MSALGWSSWPNRATPRKFARPKLPRRKRQTPPDAKWPPRGFSGSRSSAIRRRPGFTLETAQATCRTLSSSATGSFYVVKNSKLRFCSKAQARANLPKKSRKNAIGSSELATLPVAARRITWSGRSSASPGSTVTEGQTILDLADCAHRFVVVDLPEREFEQIKASEAASVRLIGSDEWRSRQGPTGNGLGSPHRRSATCRANSSSDLEQYFGRG